MSFIILIKNYFDIIYSTIDQLFNFFDLDNLEKLSQITTYYLNYDGVFFEPIDLIQKISNTIKNYLNLNYSIYIYYPLVESIKYFLIELISCKWLINFVNLTQLIPTVKALIINEKCFFESQYTSNITILHLPLYQDNKFFIGFLNGLFLSLPFSCNQLICLYRLITKGPFFSFVAILGSIVGQCILFTFILFGFRPIIISWFHLEPLTYFFGIYLIIKFLYNTLQKINSKEHIEEIFIIHCLLSWTENISFFHHLSNINFNIEPYVLTTFPSINLSEYILVHGSYIFGIFISYLLFSYIYNILIINFFLRIFHFCYRSCKDLISFLSITLLSLITALTIGSLSYYNIGYLITNPFGFIPQDKLLSRILLNTSAIDPMPKNMRATGIGNISLSPEKSNFKNSFIYSDILSFDKKEYKNSLEFEDINYQAEYAWNERNQKFTLIPIKKIKYNSIKLRPYFQNNISSQIFVKPKILLIKTNLYKDFLDTKSFQNNYKFSQIKEILDENFKTDFLPYNKYQFISSTEPIRRKKILKQIEIENEIKQKYYTNFLYKSLLDFEVDNIISRQKLIPLEFENNELFKRRIALSNYYESNYYYSKLSHFENFRELFYNSKSYSNNVYNQQFKGTLRIVEKIFPITLNENNLSNQRETLKYDNIEFIHDKNNLNYFYHEELHRRDKPYISNYKGLINTTSNPFYLGWNEDLNQLVITNNIFIPLIKKDCTYNRYGLNYLTIPNIQKFNNLLRQSYAIVNYPFLKNNLIDKRDHDRINLLLQNELFNNLDAEHFIYIRLNTQSRPLKGGFNWFNKFNWFSLRNKQYWNLEEGLSKSK